MSCALDYQTTPFELFINELSAESKDKLPKPVPKRIAIVQVTRESLALERLDQYASSSIVICFDNEQELEDFQPLSLYPTKTKPEITGTPYFQAKIETNRRRTTSPYPGRRGPHASVLGTTGRPPWRNGRDT